MIRSERHPPGSPEQDDYFRRLYESGMSSNEIGVKNGYLRGSDVRKAVLRAGGELREPDPTKLLRLYENGMILAEIAFRCDLPITAARQMIVDAGGKIRERRKRRSIDPHDAWRLYQTGMTLRQVGKALDTSDTNIHTILIGAGYKTRPKRQPAENIDRIVELRRSGMTLEEIGKEIGVSMTTVHKRLRNAGVKIGRCRYTRWRCTDIDQVVELRRNGMTLVQIAEKLGGSRETVRQRLKEADARAEGDDGGSRRPG